LKRTFNFEIQATKSAKNAQICQLSLTKMKQKINLTEIKFRQKHWESSLLNYLKK